MQPVEAVRHRGSIAMPIEISDAVEGLPSSTEALRDGTVVLVGPATRAKLRSCRRERPTRPGKGAGISLRRAAVTSSQRASRGCRICRGC